MRMKRAVCPFMWGSLRSCSSNLRPRQAGSDSSRAVIRVPQSQGTRALRQFREAFGAQCGCLTSALCPFENNRVTVSKIPLSTVGASWGVGKTA